MKRKAGKSGVQVEVQPTSAKRRGASRTSIKGELIDRASTCQLRDTKEARRRSQLRKQSPRQGIAKKPLNIGL